MKTSYHKLFKGAGAIAAAVLIAISTAYGATEEEQGFEIAARSDRSDRGFGDSRVEMNMILRNAAGRESVRTLRLDTLEIQDESVGDKSLIVFSNPRDIDGTALLSHAQMLDPDDQWLYLPALKRVKRISSVNKSGRDARRHSLRVPYGWRGDRLDHTHSFGRLRGAELLDVQHQCGNGLVNRAGCREAQHCAARRSAYSVSCRIPFRSL